MELEPEAHSHPRHVGLPWIDLILAISALALSIASIIISVQNEANMKRLVTANSWPNIQLAHGNLSSNGDRALHFDANNAGIGPATLEKLVVTYDGATMADARELLRRCCGTTENPAELIINSAQYHVFSPRESLTFLQLPRTEHNAAIWDKLNTERFKINLLACYSSVFGEHWMTSLRQPLPVSVKSCEALPGTPFNAAIYEPGH